MRFFASITSHPDGLPQWESYHTGCCGEFLSTIQNISARKALSRSDILAGNGARNHFLSALNDNIERFTLYNFGHMNAGGKAKT